jgi:DMSO/TMAO reductase YedYZ molybdopterin-dependent catalytic subunit
MDIRPSPQLPPRQQLAAAGKWPAVGECAALPHDDPWRVTVCGAVAHPLDLSLAELQAFPLIDRQVDIHCVTRWSKLGVPFRGVSLATILAVAAPTRAARFVSFVAHTARKHSTSLPLADALELGTLIAWQCDGQPLAAPHGGPVRVIVPGRYFYKSLKWLRTIALLADDALGYWEREAGYHNIGDPWREERYMASNLTRQQLQTALSRRDFAGLNLLGLDARLHDLSGLNARGALLRNADFRACRLTAADFTEANLSNAHLGDAILSAARFINADVEGADFSGADLRGADFTGASLLGTTFFTHESGARPISAIIDASTTLPPAAIENLTPPQAEFVRESLIHPANPPQRPRISE